MNEIRFNQDGRFAAALDFVEFEQKVLAENMLYICLSLDTQSDSGIDSQWAFDYINTTMYLITGKATCFSDKKDIAALVEAINHNAK